MRLPLHLKPEDRSEEANTLRVHLHITAAQIFRNGWRTPSGKKGKTKKSHNIPSRMERLAGAV